MLTLDFILLFIVLGFVILGLFLGFIHTLGAILGVFVGVFVAGHIFEPIGEALSFLFLGNTNMAKWVVFIIIYLFVNRLFGVIFWLAKTFLKILFVIPFVKSLDRLAGAVLGFGEGVLSLSAILYIAIQFPLKESMVSLLGSSSFAKYLLVVAKILIPLLPDSLQKMI